MDYGTLPPEINSGRMYAGPGSGPIHGCRGGVGPTGCRTGFRRRRLFRLDRGVDGGMAGSVVGGDGGRGCAVRDVDERDRRAGRADRDTGQGRGDRV